MANCLDDADWGSKVPRNGSKEKGKFKITRDLGGGYFEGKFKEDGGPTEDIAGQCDAATIWFLKPATNPVYRYSGNFIYVNGEKRFIDGKRDLVGIDAEATEGQAVILPLPPGDDWEGDKTT